MTGELATNQTITKQIELDMLREDYWIAMDLCTSAASKQEKRAYAILAGLINSLLRKVEK